MTTDTVTIYRTCPFTQKVNPMTLPISEKQYWAGITAWESGTYIQDAFPTLNADEREFIKTGITPTMWSSIFGEEK